MAHGPRVHVTGALCADLILIASPEKIVLSGGVMQRTSLFPRIRTATQVTTTTAAAAHALCPRARAATQDHLSGYIDVPAVTTQRGIDALIGPSEWGNNAGLIGALTLAELAGQDLDDQAGTGASARSEGRAAAAIAVAALGGAALGFALAKASK